MSSSGFSGTQEVLMLSDRFCLSL